jgi:signal transduction histidine kinase
MRRSAVLDLAVVAVVGAAGAARELGLPDQPSRLVQGPVAFYVAVHLASAAALVWRRSRPVESAAVIAALSVLTPTYASFFSAYAVGRYGERRWRWVALAAVPIAWMVGAGTWAMTMPEDRVLGPMLIVVCGVVGLYVGARRRLLTALVEQARAEERVRLAGEMHDVVTHRVNLMVLQAGALQVSATDPAVRVAAEELRGSGAQALAELRDLVGVLRSKPSEPVETTADEQSLTDLVAASAAAGVNVELTEEGSRERVAPTVRRTLFRVVQESLTNATKHAPGSFVNVHVRYAPDRLRVAVRNSPASRTPDADLAGAGSGLEGLSERVRMVGGTFAAGPTPEGGFEVRAELPPYVPTTAVGR